MDRMMGHFPNDPYNIYNVVYDYGNPPAIVDNGLYIMPMMQEHIPNSPLLYQMQDQYEDNGRRYGSDEQLNNSREYHRGHEPRDIDEREKEPEEKRHSGSGRQFRGGGGNQDSEEEREYQRDRERRRERRRRDREEDNRRSYEDRYDDRRSSRSYESRRNFRHGSRYDDNNERSSSKFDRGDDSDDSYHDDESNGGRRSRRNRSSERRSGSGGRTRESSSHSRDHRVSDKWLTESPTNTIILRGLQQSVDEQTIRNELLRQNIIPKDVRVVKHKDTGVPRGFAFVEFQNTVDAQQWMELTQGRLLLLDKYNISLYYSNPKMPQVDPRSADWTCIRCGTHNFKRREHCFRCSMLRDESEKAQDADGYDQVGNNPCNTLILRGLDALTTNENITIALGTVSALPIKNALVMKDDLTGTSKGYAFVEMNSVQDGSHMLEAIHTLAGSFEIDGKAIIVSYAKNTFSTVMATKIQQQSSWNQNDANRASGHTNAASHDSSYYDYSTYYSQPTNAMQSDSANAAAAVAQVAIQQAQAAKNYYKQDKPAVVEQPKTEAAQPYQKYSTPDVSQYQYDETSGYYYDPVTGLYYDANTQYYYNNQTCQFLYWDGEKQTYLPAPVQDSTTTSAQAQMTATLTMSAQKKPEPEKEKKDAEKKEKVKIAKKIASDMQKWAKTLNAQKEVQKEMLMKTIQQQQQAAIQQSQLGMAAESPAADTAFSLLEKRSADRQPELVKLANEDRPLILAPSTSSLSTLSVASNSMAPGLVASYGSDSGSDEDDDASGQSLEDRFMDLNKMACLLCKRQFSNRDTLQKHQQLSDLHKKNLEEFKKMKAAASQSSSSSQISYRDRAKERRQKYGAPEPPQPRAPKIPLPPPVIPFEQPTKQGIGADNVGNKLMQKMGWSAGQGLGKANQGIVDPIEAIRRQAQMGLGTKATPVDIQPGDTYRDVVKKTLFARFNDID